MVTETSAGAVVFCRGEKIEYLLLRANYWGFAKGRVEPGEDERTTARREVCEETGLEVSLLDGFREVDDYWFQRKGTRIHKQAIFYLGEAPSRAFKISWEHEEAAWFTFDAAMEKLKFAGLRQLLTRADAFLKRGT